MNRLISHGLSGPCASMFESNTWPDVMDVRFLGQMIFRIVDKSSYKSFPEEDCKCALYNINTKESSHFATFPPALILPCILAGCPKEVCVECGEPRSRIIEKTGQSTYEKVKDESWRQMNEHAVEKGIVPSRPNSGQTRLPNGTQPHLDAAPAETTGWTRCKCNAGFRPGITLEPFMGTAVTAMVAYQNNRDYVGCELNPEYIKLAEKRIRAESDKYGLLEIQPK